jgi:type IV pilus assembly protein PilB
MVQKQPLVEAIREAKKGGKRLGEILLDKGLVREDVLARAIAKQFDLKYVNLDKVQISEEAHKLLDAGILKKYTILPLGMVNSKLKLAISDPMNLEALDAVRFRLNTELDCYVASARQIRTYIDKTFEEDKKDEDDRLKASIDVTAKELMEAGQAIHAEVLRAQASGGQDDGPIVRLANLIIDDAYYMRASDIHFEPMADRVRVRYRVDGVCLEKDNIPKNMQAALLTRLKILSGMDIAEKRLPQDGRIKRVIGGQDVDFRVSALPGNHGESVVLRILRPDAVNIGIRSLGFEQEDYERFQKIIKRPNGIFLVTGPTGSGKTTTLYAALQELNKSDRKIITAEDPVEYNFDGMNQCQVKEDIGLTFERILRSMLRQAPNIILVGEIRDSIVADVAIQAALTGHLVFSTLHTNDASSAITRLIDMGVKPFLVASSIQAIMAQRLVRVICKNCKRIDERPNPHHLRLLNISEEDARKHPIYKGSGCIQCAGTGYRGRIGVFEMLEMNMEIRDLAFSKAPAAEIRKVAVSSGMRTLGEDGVLKIYKGITAPDEVVKIAQMEGVFA